MSGYQTDIMILKDKVKALENKVKELEELTEILIKVLSNLQVDATLKVIPNIDEESIRIISRFMEGRTRKLMA